MSLSTFEEVLANTKNTLQCLEQLKLQHDQLLNGLRASKQISASIHGDTILTDDNTLNVEERLAVVMRSLNRIDDGLQDGQFMMNIYGYIKQLEGDKRVLGAQVKRLCQENSWLRDELAISHRNIQQGDLKIAALEVEKQHLEFQNSLKKYDEPNALSALPSLDIPEVPEPSASELGFEQDDANDRQDCSYGAQDGSNSAGEIPGRLRTLHNLVIHYAQQGRYEVAIPLCKQALEDLEKSLTHNHPDVATMLNILALVYRDKKMYREAGNLLQDALNIRETTLGTDHPSVAATLNNLSVLYGRRGRYKDAEPLCKRALDIREKALGNDHPDVAKQLNNLALLCQNQNKYDEVEMYYKRALSIYESRLGPDDPNVVKTKNNLASAYIKQTKYDLAEQLYVDVLTRALDLETACQVSNSSDEHKKSKDSLPYEDLGSWHKTVQVDSPTVSTTLKNLALLYRKRYKTEAAEILEDFAVKARKNALDSHRRAQLQEILNASGEMSNVSANFNSSSGIHFNSSEGVDFGADWSSAGDGSLRRAGSFSKLKESIKQSSSRFFKAAFSKTSAPPPSSGMKRASSLSMLNHKSSDGYQMGAWNNEI